MSGDKKEEKSNLKKRKVKISNEENLSNSEEEIQDKSFDEYSDDNSTADERDSHQVEEDINLKPTGRRSIHDQPSRTPIKKSEVKPKFNKKDEIHSINIIVLTISAVIIIVAITAIFWMKLNENSSLNIVKPFIKFDTIKSKFPKQDQKLWKAVEIGLNETRFKERPSSYIFLHENDDENTTNMLINEISKYAVCQISDCTKPPIFLNKTLWKSSEFSKIDDYGYIIAHFRPILEERGVMIVNLDEVPEKYALSFHSFCDEVSPAVGKSAFFFTMKIDKFNTSPLMDLRFVEKKLKEMWKNLKEDVFDPLFARMTPMLLRVHPEK